MLSMVLMTIIGGYAFDLTSQGMYFVNRLKKSAQTQFLAEAGLAAAFSVLNSDFSSVTDSTKFPLTTLSMGSYDATVTTTSGRTLVSCVGTVDGITRTVSAEVKGPAPSALDYAMAGNTVSFSLAGQSSVTISGKVYSDTATVLDAASGSSSITIGSSGAVDSGGTITASGSGAVTTGTQTSGASLAGYPVFDFSYYQNIAQNQSGLYVSGDVTYNTTNAMPSPSGRVIFVNGNVTVSSAQSSSAALVATGSITITSGTTTLSPPSNYPAMMTQSLPITISGTGDSSPSGLVANGVVYSGNNFTVTGNHHTVTVNGAIVARGSLTGNSSGFSQNTITVNYVSANLAGLTSTGATSGLTVLSVNQ